MLIFLDESIRKHVRTGADFGVLSGIAIPEDTFHIFQRDIFDVRRPYHGVVLGENDELHGQLLLNKATLKKIKLTGSSDHWNLVENILKKIRATKVKVFGVVCFRAGLQSFICNDETKLDIPYRYLFERIDYYVKREFPTRRAKLIFDNRDHRTNEKNAKSITNFFVKSAIGTGYDSILRVPFFAVSQGHNYGLQVADLVTTVIAQFFQGNREYEPLWEIVKDMLYEIPLGGQVINSLKVIRQKPASP